MAVNTRPWFVWFDGTADIPMPLQGDHPKTSEFIPIASGNRRVMTGSDGNPYTISDLTVVPRNAKNIIWSSEGYTSNLNVIVPTLTAPQRIANGTNATNATAVTLDASPYRNLLLMVNLTSLTAGSSPSIQFELDYLDDAATPNSFVAWKPAALTAAGSWYVSIGAGNVLLQAAAAPQAPITGGAVIVDPSGWTIESIPLQFSPNIKFAWTVANTPTAAVWQATIYGIH